jgi:hypothetical protein
VYHDKNVYYGRGIKEIQLGGSWSSFPDMDTYNYTILKKQLFFPICYFARISSGLASSGNNEVQSGANR